MNGVDALTKRLSVLLVDDDAGVRKALERVLCGHDATHASSVDEALSALDLSSQFDVLLVDVTMPGRNGTDLYGELQRSWPFLVVRTIFVTAGVDSQPVCDFLIRCGRPIVHKPFRRATLRELASRVANGMA